MLISYKWLQTYFEEKLPAVDTLSDGLTFHAFGVEGVNEVAEDTVLDVDVLPNRAHDCLSYWGVAKEVSAIFDLKLKEKKFNNLGSDNAETDLQIKVEDDRCLRYMGRIVRNIKVGESPNWLKERLESIGQKSINNIVDLANFVMFDTGQPIHCFDLDKLESPEILIRKASNGEQLITLDGKKLELDDSILVIADTKDPLVIAGIKGGTKAEVDKNTKNIVIEVANFEFASTRKTSKKIKILTDAVKRYENELSPELCGIAMEEVTSLIKEVIGGDEEKVIDIYPKQAVKKEIKVSTDYINKSLGSNFSKLEIQSVWDKLKFKYEIEGNSFKIKIPILRLDLNYDYDLLEEVGRILGYDRLEGKLPKDKLDVLKNSQQDKDSIFYKMLACREELLNEGYSEVMTYVFRDKGDIEILASASDKNFLRTNLSDGLGESIKLNTINAPLLGLDKIKVFEIGTVFTKNGEKMHVAYGDKKEIVEKTLDEFIKEKNLEVNKKKLLENINISEEKKETFTPWSAYPFITRDISVWVEEGTQADELSKIYKKLGTSLLVNDPYLFDQFTKPAGEGEEKGKTSYAFRLVFQSFEKTLTDKEINKIMTQIESAISARGWTVR